MRADNSKKTNSKQTTKQKTVSKGLKNKYDSQIFKMITEILFFKEGDDSPYFRLIFLSPWIGENFSTLASVLSKELISTVKERANRSVDQ